MSKPRVTIEKVNAGRYFVDCTACGAIGCWPDRTSALTVKGEHRCGEPSTVPGKWGPADRIGGL